MDSPVVFERNGHLYIVGAVAPITPQAADLAEFAFATELHSQAPNENLLWLRGQYVEADRPNQNGQFWGSNELAIKSLTPRLMPVTVMHGARDVVGLIADTKLLLPEVASVPRARIETALAIWSHRFPEIAEEVDHNYKLGTLMQSMECDISHYDCIECGKSYVKLPDGAERANWCDHLRQGAENGVPVRRLEGVTFTGTGLIFGSRNGATGALDTAHLETFQTEVAEFHERAHTDRRRVTRRTSVDITIPRSEYDALVAKAGKADEAAAKVTTLSAEVSTLTTANEKLEIDLKTKTDEAAAEKAARETLEETSRTATLATGRFEKLGTALIAKLPDTIKAKVQEQAKTFSDDDWTGRTEELALMTGIEVGKDAPAAPEGELAPGATSATELASTGATAPTTSRAATSTVLGGIFDLVKPVKPSTGAKA